MTDTARRRKYSEDRVLIESSRVLSTTFGPAVIYLTGPQVEMLRNVAQYLRRQETYVAAYASGYYLTPTVEDFDDVLAIVADLEETLMGNPNTIWGYSDRWTQFKMATSTGAYFTYCVTSEVPAGYVYVLEHWNAYHLADDPLGVLVGLGSTASTPVLYDAPNVAGNDIIKQSEYLTLKEGDVLAVRFTSLPEGDGARLRVWGHKMIVPE